MPNSVDFGLVKNIMFYIMSECECVGVVGFGFSSVTLSNCNYIVNVSCFTLTMLLVEI